MLEEILYTISISPQIEKSILVTKEEKAIEIGKKFNTITIIDEKEESVNSAIALADKYLLENNFDASIVFPQDIPYIKTQDIDFMLNYKAPPNFAIVVPSRRFDGTNALVRMPVDLMETHYDEDSYKNSYEYCQRTHTKYSNGFCKKNHVGCRQYWRFGFSITTKWKATDCRKNQKNFRHKLISYIKK